jgi:hypothetical protein
MIDLIIRGGLVVDPLNKVHGVRDIAVQDGKIAEIREEITVSAKKEISASGKVVIPGIIDMHTHMRTVLGHKHAQRMIALAGVCTTLDMAGPLEDILTSIPTSGAGVNIAVLEAARDGQTLSSSRPSLAEQEAFVEKTLEAGGIGIKLLGGHFPMDTDISESFIGICSQKKAWIGWHVGSTKHGSNIEGMREAVSAANGRFLHIAHINSYCRGQISSETEEALEAISLLKANPNIFSESYLSPLNGTRIIVKDNVPTSKVTTTCLKRFGYSNDYAGMKQAILDGAAGVLADNGTIGALLKGKEGADYWEEKETLCTGCFAVNPAISRFLVATAKRDDGSFVVDSFSTDGGCYPRNVIAENGLLLVKFGALTLDEFAVKASLNGARALGLPDKGHLAAGADADITILDAEAEKACCTIAGGKVIMQDGRLLGSGTTIICDERGAAALAKRNIRHTVKKTFTPEQITRRFIP